MESQDQHCLALCSIASTVALGLIIRNTMRAGRQSEETDSKPIAPVLASFWPCQVVYLYSDFMTNKHKHLLENKLDTCATYQDKKDSPVHSNVESPPALPTKMVLCSDHQAMPNLQPIFDISSDPILGRQSPEPIAENTAPIEVSHSEIPCVVEGLHKIREHLVANESPPSKLVEDVEAILGSMRAVGIISDDSVQIHKSAAHRLVAKLYHKKLHKSIYFNHHQAPNRPFKSFFIQAFR